MYACSQTVEEEALIKNNNTCKDFLIEAMKYHLLPLDQRQLIKNPRTKPRTPVSLPKVSQVPFQTGEGRCHCVTSHNVTGGIFCLLKGAYVLLQCFLTLSCLHFNRSEPIRGSPWSGCELRVVANPQCLCWVSRAGEGLLGECAMSSYNWCCWRPGVSSGKMLPSDSEQNCRHELKSAGVRCYCSQWRHQEFTSACERRAEVTAAEGECLSPVWKWI